LEQDIAAHLLQSTMLSCHEIYWKKSRQPHWQLQDLSECNLAMMGQGFPNNCVPGTKTPPQKKEKKS
jgi:hypothetical protein